MEEDLAEADAADADTLVAEAIDDAFVDLSEVWLLPPLPLGLLDRFVDLPSLEAANLFQMSMLF